MADARRPPKLILIVSQPRCGSTWLYNAYKSVCRGAGFDVRPDNIQLRDQDLSTTIAAAGRDRDEAAVYLAKTHKAVGPAQDGVLAASILRDPRDMALSYRAFVGGAEMETPLMFRVGELIDKYNRIASIYGSRIHWFHYADIGRRPAALIGALRRTLALPAHPDDDRAIAESLTPEAVQRIVASAESVPDVARPIDRRTGFQAGHIRGGGDGAWRREIDAGTLARIHAAFGDWLTARGFPLS